MEKKRFPIPWAAINWKRWLKLVIFSTTSGFMLHVLVDAIAHRPPAWLQTRRITGPSLRRDVLGQFQRMASLAEQEAERLRVAEVSVQLYEVRRGKSEAIVWSLEEYVNRGFDAQSHFQHELRIPEQQVLGFYTLEGKPLSATIRRLAYLEGQPLNVEFTVGSPVQPGERLRVIRLDRSRAIAETMQKDAYLLALDRVPDTNMAVAVRLAYFPKGASVVRYSPDTGFSSVFAGKPTVSWRNSDSNPHDPAPSVTFRWSP